MASNNDDLIVVDKESVPNYNNDDSNLNVLGKNKRGHNEFLK